MSFMESAKGYAGKAYDVAKKAATNPAVAFGAGVVTGYALHDPLHDYAIDPAAEWWKTRKKEKAKKAKAEK